MQHYLKKKGFTLLELMIVVIIIGILATIAIPRFTTAVSRARWSAGASILSSIRSSQLRYHNEYGDYSGAMGNLDIVVDDTPDWTIQDPAGTSAEVGKVQHVGTATDYTIGADGTIAPVQP